MKSMNKTQLIGYLGQDPEFRTLATGTLIAKLRLSTHTKTKQKDLFGQAVYQTTWHNVSVWGQERVEKMVNQYIKGSHVLVEGSLEYQTYTDKAGKKRYVTEINAYTIMNLDR
jgi:single-strand DNA-binding protein